MSGEEAAADDNDAAPAERIGDWAKYIDEEQNAPYYVNEETGETTWDPPPGWAVPGAVVSEDASLPVSPAPQASVDRCFRCGLREQK